MKAPRSLRFVVGVGLLTFFSTPGLAVPVVFSGYDNGAGSLAAAPLATGAAAAFDAAAPGLPAIDFESGLPMGVSVSSFGIPGTIEDGALSCGAVFCGYNTTPGGSLVFRVTGQGVHTFSFATPIDSFGGYFTGWQLDTQILELTYADLTTVTLDMPAGGQGGTLFYGFQDAGASIVSVSYTNRGDIVAVDDIRYGRAAVAAVPEPSTIALVSLSIVSVFGATWQRKAS